MRKVFRLFVIFSVIVLFSSYASGQDKQKAKQSVNKYMTEKYVNYNSGKFGYFKTDYNEDSIHEPNFGNVKYSIIHSYKLGEKKIEDDSFYLDENYIVIKILSKEERIKNIANNFITYLDTTGQLIKQKPIETEVDFDRKQLEISFLKAHMEKQRKDYKKAIEYYTQAIEINSMESNVYFYRGQCYRKIRKKELACNDFNKAKEIGCSIDELEVELKKCK